MTLETFIFAHLQSTKEPLLCLCYHLVPASAGQRYHLEYLIRSLCFSLSSRCCSQVNRTGRAFGLLGNICPTDCVMSVVHTTTTHFSHSVLIRARLTLTEGTFKHVVIFFFHFPIMIDNNLSCTLVLYIFHIFYCIYFIYKGLYTVLSLPLLSIFTFLFSAILIYIYIFIA